MKCIAIDDEPVALSIIEQFCKRCGDLEVTSYTDPITGLEKVKSSRPDIVFLDIEMGGINGIDIARELPAGIYLIFTTAYAEYAVDGFELNAIDYLHKPFSYSRFEKAKEEEITLKVEYKNVKIKIASIEYIEAMDNYIKIYLTDDDKPVLSQTSMKSIMEMLPEDRFMRVHKSYIVPLHKVANYTRRQLTLYHRAVEIPIGRVYADEFINRLGEMHLSGKKESYGMCRKPEQGYRLFKDKSPLNLPVQVLHYLAHLYWSKQPAQSSPVIHYMRIGDFMKCHKHRCEYGIKYHGNRKCQSYLLP